MSWPLLFSSAVLVQPPAVDHGGAVKQRSVGLGSCKALPDTAAEARCHSLLLAGRRQPGTGSCWGQKAPAKRPVEQKCYSS
jgi:hypothetical protein